MTAPQGIYDDLAKSSAVYAAANPLGFDPDEKAPRLQPVLVIRTPYTAHDPLTNTFTPVLTTTVGIKWIASDGQWYGGWMPVEEP